jgi:ubiquinone/menaquinone biosynthesis C-methylase UbiE
VLYLRWQSRTKRAENEAFLALHGAVAPETERQKAISHLLSGDAQRVDSNEHFEGSRNCSVVRKRAVMMTRGDVLEIGFGTGEKTLPFYERNQGVKSITAVDNHALSLDVCRLKIESGELKLNKPLTLVNARAESLPFDDKSFDTVLSEFSLCAVEDPVQALREMARVAKHRVVILEHGLSYWSVIRKLGYWTSLFPDPQHPWSYGCYQDRDILDIVKQSGVKVKKMQMSSLGHVYLLTIAPSESDNPIVRDLPKPHVVYSSPSSS